jgi:V/A-type H+-transporting ATPase subunit B
LTDYDERCLSYAKEYSKELLAIDVNIDAEKMLDTGWEILGKYFTQDEVAMKKVLMDKYWKGK